MKIAVGSDKTGSALKDVLKERLLSQDIEVIDCGVGATVDEAPSKVAELIRDGKADGGILVDETGAASSIVANKVPGIRAAQVSDLYSARLTKAHNLANVLCFGSAITGPVTAWECVKIWIDTEFMKGNHSIRLAMIEELEKRFAK